MISGGFGDDWKWLPLLLLGGAVAFMFLDPLGMKGSQVTYVINPPAPVAATIPPQQPPQQPPGNPPGGPPPVAGFPTFDSTGPKTQPATAYAGPVIINTSNQTFDGVIFSTCIQIIADNITIRNARFEAACPGSPMVWHREGVNLVVEDSEFIGLKQNNGIPASAVTCSSCTVSRNRLRGTADGFNPNGTAQIIGNYVGQLGGGLIGGGPTHSDGFQIANGNGVVIRNNTVDNDCGVVQQEAGGTGGCNTAVFFQPYCGGCSIGGAVVEQNYFRKWNGPANTVHHVIMVDGSTNIRVNNNVFGDVVGSFCTLKAGGTITEFNGNTREDGSAVARNC